MPGLKTFAKTQGVRAKARGLLAIKCAARVGLLLAGLTLHGADFYVAPNGDDSHPGTKRQPFATLERARGAVREQKLRESNRDFVVLLRGGVYRLRETIVFSLQDSASEGHTITYAAFGNETPVFSSGSLTCLVSNSASNSV